MNGKPERYKRELPFSYGLGMFPSMELLQRRPLALRRLLLHSAAKQDSVERLVMGCAELGIEPEIRDRDIERLSGKENCFAVTVFEKYANTLEPQANHLVLHQPGDMGNVGTILRTALGFKIRNVAVINPGADPWEPRVVRASMGAIFGLELEEFDDFEQYAARFSQRRISQRRMLPFMLQGALPLKEAPITPPLSLIFGNEARGLPPEFAQYGAVRINHENTIDSLNVAVAAGIALHHFYDVEE